MKEQVKKVAAIHDISGLGRCSLTAVIPILSVLEVQPCPFPTAVLSLQTGYDNFSFYDLNDEMKEYKNSWSKEKINFSGIYSGFLGSPNQIDTVLDFINEHDESLVIVDPVMGDNGEKYSTFSDEMCIKMKELVKKANIITPNLTEALMLLNKNYNDFIINTDNLLEISKDLSKIGPQKIIITGIVNDDLIKNFVYDSENNDFFEINTKWNNKHYSGTGDVFASVVCGMSIRGFNLELSVKKAVEFISNSIEFTDENCDTKNGVSFEPMLHKLINL